MRRAVGSSDDTPNSGDRSVERIAEAAFARLEAATRDRIFGVISDHEDELRRVVGEQSATLEARAVAAEVGLERRQQERFAVHTARHEARMIELSKELAAKSIRSAIEVRKALEAALPAAVAKEVESGAGDVEARVMETARADFERIRNEISSEIQSGVRNQAESLERAADAKLVTIEDRLSAKVSERLMQVGRALSEQVASDAESAREGIAAQLEASVDRIRHEAVEAAARRSSEQVDRRLSDVEERLRGQNAVTLAAAIDAARDELDNAADARVDATADRVASEVESRLADAFGARAAEEVSRASRELAERFDAAVEERVTGVEQRVGEVASARAAEHAAVISARSSELARQNRAAAESVAREMAAGESQRWFAELEPVLSARIEAAAKETRAASEEARAALTASTEDAARRRLDEAIAKVRAEGELKARAEIDAIRADAEAAQGAMAGIQELESRARSVLGRIDERLDSTSQELTQSAADAARLAQESAAHADAARADRERAEALRDELTQGMESGRAAVDESVADAIRRLEATIVEIEGSRARIAQLQERATSAEREASRSAQLARNAVVLEARMRKALALEAKAAEQITLAERRLIDLVDQA